MSKKTTLYTMTCQDCNVIYKLAWIKFHNHRSDIEYCPNCGNEDTVTVIEEDEFNAKFDIDYDEIE